ncbi:MAG: hypothetical protein ACKVYV_13450, partial [Limisphaerales bacterium]
VRWQRATRGLSQAVRPVPGCSALAGGGKKSGGVFGVARYLARPFAGGRTRSRFVRTLERGSNQKFQVQ